MYWCDQNQREKHHFKIHSRHFLRYRQQQKSSIKYLQVLKLTSSPSRVYWNTKTGGRLFLFNISYICIIPLHKMECSSTLKGSSVRRHAQKYDYSCVTITKYKKDTQKHRCRFRKLKKYTKFNMSQTIITLQDKKRKKKRKVIKTVVWRHPVVKHIRCSSDALPVLQSTRKWNRWMRNDINQPSPLSKPGTYRSSPAGRWQFTSHHGDVDIPEVDPRDVPRAVRRSAAS